MKKVSAGDPLAIRAADWNRLSDIAGTYPQNPAQGAMSRRAGGREPPGDKHNRIRLRNRSKGTRRRGEILQIDAQLTDVLDPAYVGLDGITPTAGEHCWAVLQEDLPNPAGEKPIGQAAISGATIALVCIRDVAHRYCVVEPGNCLLQSADAGPFPILSPPPAAACEQEALILLPTSCGEATSTTTTAEDLPAVTPTCAGQCKWVASATLTWTLVVDGCTPATTTSTTAAPSTTTTAYCCRQAGTSAEPTTSTTSDPSTTLDPTSTTAAPTTTTTPDPCECVQPAFCPSVAGQCTYTSCAPPGTSSPVSCPTTTTTCECVPIADCTDGCDWIAVGSSWKRIADHCTGPCRCFPPNGSPSNLCETANTPCVILPAPNAPCQGLCYWLWAAPLGAWIAAPDMTSGCNTTYRGCHCPTPTVADPCGPDPDECCYEITACVWNGPPGTTTTGAVSPCDYYCWGSTTTTTPETCLTAECTLTAYESSPGVYAWLVAASSCPPSCPCGIPALPPTEACALIKSACVGTSTTPDPTSTTAAPTTSTTCGCDRCDPFVPPTYDNSVWLCADGVWVACAQNCPEGEAGSPPAMNCVPGDCACGTGTCQPVPTTTTPPPTSTTPPPTSTTPSGSTPPPTTTTGGGGCWITSATLAARGLPDTCQELCTLRKYRDTYVKQLPQGRTVLDAYYATAPDLVAAIDASWCRRRIYRRIFDALIVPSCQDIAAGRNERAYRRYERMTNALMRHFRLPPIQPPLSLQAALDLTANYPYHTTRQNCAAVTTYINPTHSATRAAAYTTFAAQFPRLGMDLYTAEGSVDGTYALPTAHRFDLRGTAYSVGREQLWWKENLLNLLIRRLPDAVDYVLWIDADVLLLAPDYVDRLQQALSEHTVVQAARQMAHLDAAGQPQSWRLGLAYSNHLHRRRSAAVDAGWPGLLWAAPRDLLTRVGLYDRTISGAGDCVWAAAVYDDFAALAARPWWSPALLADVRRYIASVAPLVRSVGYVPADVLHLYHGPIPARQYFARHAVLNQHVYDPLQHVEYDTAGVIHWSPTAPPALRQAIQHYLIAKEI